jgi:hypothetical protein
VGNDQTQLWDTGAWALNVARLRLDLYHLVAALLASDKFAMSQFEAERAAWPREGELPKVDALQRLAQDYETTDIEHGLVSVAAMTRVLLDQLSPRPTVVRAWCGTLVPDISRLHVEKPLTLRDACNKVMHATSRSFVSEADGPGLVARMSLTGSQLGQQWAAELHILPFASHVAALTERPPEGGV